MGLDGNEGYGKYITLLSGLQVSFIIIYSECSIPEQGPDYSALCTTALHCNSNCDGQKHVLLNSTPLIRGVINAVAVIVHTNTVYPNTVPYYSIYCNQNSES